MPFDPLTMIPHVLGTGMGMLLGEYNDQRQLRQQQKLTDQQVAASKDLSTFNNEQQYQMWLKTNYPAQMEQLRKAGLNPGLLYGMGGGGGATTGSGGGGSVTGGMATGHSGEVMGMLQAGLLQAQKENIEADTKLKNTTADKTSGVDTELGKSQIASITQGINNQKAVERLTNLQSDIAEIEQDIKHRTTENAIHRIESEANAAMYQMELLSAKYGVEKDLIETRKQIVREELATILLRKELTSAQTQEVLQSIKSQIEHIRQGDEHLDVERVRNELINKGIWVGAATNVVNSVINLIKTPKRLGETVTEIFDDKQGNKTISTRRQ